MMELKLFGACNGNPARGAISRGVSKNSEADDSFDKDTQPLKTLNTCIYIEIKA